MKDKVEDDPEMEAVVHSISRHLAVSTKKRMKIQEATKRDRVLQRVLRYHEEGWPEEKHEVPDYLLQYGKLKTDLSVDDNLLFLHDRVVIPFELRDELLQQIHEGHQGVEKCKLRARSTVYWPGINKDIEETVARCPVCQKFQHQNKKETLIPHEIPDRAWKKIAADILTFANTDFLVIIDYYSNWMELIKLHYKTAAELIVKFEEMFARNGTPEELVSDNMPFNSHNFKQFAETWDITLSTSSPRYPQSNGLAERAVQICKNILRKANEEHTSIYPLLLAYRNTPIKGINCSPAQAMLNRPLREKIPVVSRRLKPKIDNQIQKKKQFQRRKTKLYYDQTARDLPECRENQNVIIRKGREWIPGRIVEKHEKPRSYMVQSETNILRRNRRDLRPSLIPSPSFTPDLDDNQIINEPKTDIVIPPLPTNTENPVIVESPNVGNTRPKRNIKVPQRFKDYVMTK